MKSSRKYSMEESEFVLSVLSSVSYRSNYYDTVIRKIRKQLRSRKGRSDACKWLLGRLYSLSDKDKFLYSIIYEENGHTFYSRYSEVECKLRGLIDNE